jgi:hypothetical protein
MLKQYEYAVQPNDIGSQFTLAPGWRLVAVDGAFRYLEREVLTADTIEE